MTTMRKIEGVDPVTAGALRAMSGMARLRLAHDTWEAVQARLAAYIVRQHPGWSATEVSREVARRLLGDASRAASLRR